MCVCCVLLCVCFSGCVLLCVCVFRLLFTASIVRVRVCVCVFLCLCVCLCQHSSKLHMLPFSRGHCLCNKLILAHLTNCSSYCFCFRLIEFHLIYGAYNHAYCVQTINVLIELATRNKTNSRKKLLGTQTCGTKFVTRSVEDNEVAFSMGPNDSTADSNFFLFHFYSFFHNSQPIIR